ncbi:chromate transporter [Paraherbaspirillum soli]|uniref:Chromate transporter n=1 Tax=Paraherbaspirillum soli TaxID=631222 RepID=A0ABW0MBS5_9BURK
MLYVLAVHFFLISLIAFGGASAVLPEMHRFLVENLHLISDRDFIALNALAQAAPGPNVQIVAMYGFQVAGLSGAVVSMLAMCGPTSMLAILVESFGKRHSGTAWHKLIRRALAPLTVGLVLATGYMLSIGAARMGDSGTRPLALTAVAVGVAMSRRLSPIALIAIGCVLGAAGLI